MDILQKVVDAFIQYFTSVKEARISFWLRDPVPAQGEFVNAPVTALLFLLARFFFNARPSLAIYGMLIVGYVVVLAGMAGVACLSIPPARTNLSDNMRKFISTAWVLSTIAAVVSVADSLTGATSGLASFLVRSEWSLGNPDVVASAATSVVVALIIVWSLERLSPKPGVVDKLHYLLAALFLFLAGTLGFAIMVGAYGS